MNGPKSHRSTDMCTKFENFCHYYERSYLNLRKTIKLTATKKQY